MAIVMYDLVGQDDRRFSPHCWRTRMALAHKGLEHEARSTGFTGIPAIEDGTVKTVPALRDGARLVVDSWAIARHLEETYPERRSLFGGPGGLAVTRFVQSWSVAVLHSGLFGLIFQEKCKPHIS
jgi:glutathione S-transferase